MLERDAPINEKDSNGQSALQLASQRGQCQIAELLLNNGAANAFDDKVNLHYILLSMVKLLNYQLYIYIQFEIGTNCFTLGG